MHSAHDVSKSISTMKTVLLQGSGRNLWRSHSIVMTGTDLLVNMSSIIKVTPKLPNKMRKHFSNYIFMISDSILDVIKFVNTNQEYESFRGRSLQYHIDGLVQDCINSIANAVELLRSCTTPSI